MTINIDVMDHFQIFRLSVEILGTEEGTGWYCAYNDGRFSGGAPYLITESSVESLAANVHATFGRDKILRVKSELRDAERGSGFMYSFGIPAENLVTSYGSPGTPHMFQSGLKETFKASIDSLLEETAAAAA